LNQIIKINMPQAQFLQMPHKYRAFVGGYGCVHKDTLLRTRDGFKTISDLVFGDEVVSWNEKHQKYQLAPTSGGFQKGMANLYRVTTKQGVFDASGHHHVLTGHNTYQSVQSLSVGDELSSSAECLQATSSEFDRIWSPEDDLYYWQKSLDLTGHYESEYRQYGLSPRILKDIYRGILPSRGDALKSYPLCLNNSTSISNATIIRIEKQKAKESYWDIHVAGNNNYISKDGTIHHNSSKTYSGSLAICQHAYEWPGINQGYFAPTYPHIRDIFYETIEEVAMMMGLSVAIRIGSHEVDLSEGNKLRSTVICRSMDNPQFIIGFKIGHAMIDELDVLSTDKAQLAWRKIIARMRYNVDGLKNGIDVTTTPEGFKQTYKLFVSDPQKKPELLKNYGLIQASTYDNAVNLPDDYIPSLLEAYPAELIDAYLNGKFVNLTSGTVYRNYDRKTHGSKEVMKEREPLLIGMDFNIDHMAATIYVQRPTGFHAVAELKDILDTPAMIKILQDKYQTKEDKHRIIVYPDASGSSRKSVGASETDISLLKNAGFTIRVRGSNPVVKDRINAANKAFEDGWLHINDTACPRVAECFEQQSYDKNGQPDKKSDFDHQNDASTYPVVYERPIKRKYEGVVAPLVGYY